MTDFSRKLILTLSCWSLAIAFVWEHRQKPVTVPQHDLENGQLHYPAEAVFVEAGRISQTYGQKTPDKPHRISQPAISESKLSVKRTLSVYSDYYLGRKTRYGEKYTGEGLTVASNEWKYNTRLRITYKGKSLVVRVTDTMARRYTGIRVDASHRVWRELVGAKPGLRSVTVEKL